MSNVTNVVIRFEPYSAAKFIKYFANHNFATSSCVYCLCNIGQVIARRRRTALSCGA